MTTHQVNCQKCGRPMTIQAEPNEFMPLERLAKFATCDPCMRRSGHPVAKDPDPQRELKLPYKDL